MEEARFQAIETALIAKVRRDLNVKVMTMALNKESKSMRGAMPHYGVTYHSNR